VPWLERAVAASKAPIFCNQIEYHPYIDQGTSLGFCREWGIAVVAYCPLARGRVLEDARLAEIGRKHGKSPAHVALRWLVGQQGVVAIPKGSGADHIRENLNLFDFELDEEDLDVIGGLERGQRLIDPSWAPRWDD
jgi:diketogulonate reductase-like aldo/keto reductase